MDDVKDKKRFTQTHLSISEFKSHCYLHLHARLPPAPKKRTIDLMLPVAMNVYVFVYSISANALISDRISHKPSTAHNLYYKSSNAKQSKWNDKSRKPFNGYRFRFFFPYSLFSFDPVCLTNFFFVFLIKTRNSNLGQIICTQRRPQDRKIFLNRV